MSTSLDAHNEPKGVPSTVEGKSTLCSMIESAKAGFTVPKRLTVNETQ